MKKLFAMFLTILFVFVFAACSFVPGRFSTNGFKIQLSGDFKETTLGGFDAAYYNADLYIAAVKNSFDNIDDAENMTPAEYAEKLIKDNQIDGAKVNDLDGLVAFRYDVESNNSTFLTFVFKGKHDFWRVQFMADTDKYGELSDKILSYAKTIRVS